MQSLRKVRILALLLALFFTAPIAAALATDPLTVVATKETFDAAQKWVDLLASKGIPIKQVDPAKFATDKKSAKYVVLMGGVDEKGGVGALVKEVVGDAEYADLQKKGTGKMLQKADAWTAGQEVMVFSGSDRESAEKARTESKEKWFKVFAGWFDLDLGAQSLHGY